MYPSNLFVVELNLIEPVTGLPGLCAVVPTGKFIIPVALSFVTIIPVSSGNVIVLSAVGSVTAIVVSYAFDVEPSNEICPPAPTYRLVPFNN